jgi:radical SAM protein with 4Fe4S-binding SPASM domain
MVPVIITNASAISADLARFLYDNNSSVLFKLDTLDEERQDYLCGKRGAYRQIMAGIHNLFSAGFNRRKGGHLRCGASFVLTKINYCDIPAVWKYCRRNDIYPNMEIFIPRNRGLVNIKELQVSGANVMKLKRRLLVIDRRCYGYDWLVHSPLPGHGCLQHMYSLYIACDGFVRPCADIDIRDFNIKKMKLADVMKTPFFSLVRNIDKHLKGRCSNCAHNEICVGCRGNAFAVGTREGLDAYAAVCREDPLCLMKAV